jgi:hypothetical protein
MTTSALSSILWTTGTISLTTTSFVGAYNWVCTCVLTKTYEVSSGVYVWNVSSILSTTATTAETHISNGQISIPDSDQNIVLTFKRQTSGAVISASMRAVWE